MTDTDNIIAFQGAHGAYSDLACRNVFPDLVTLPCRTFEDAFTAIREGKAGCGMIPIENSIAGRVADIHHLLPDSGLHIIGEHFQRVNHHLMAVKSASLETITHVHSHVHALSQCRNIIRKLKIEPVVHVDTAGAAAELAERNDPSQAVIASELAAHLHGLEILAGNIEDADHNTTRFLIMTREPQVPPVGEGIVMTSFVFRVRNVAAALYKALGGFASNGINMTKLESYLVGGHFHAAQFFVEVEGHPEEPGMKDALEELGFFSHEVHILGTYPAHPYRLENAPPEED